MVFDDNSTNTSFVYNGNKSVTAVTECKPFAASGSIANQAIVTTAYLVLFLFSFVGNSLIIAVFYKENGQFKTPVNYLIANMAVSDTLVPLFTIPRRVQEVYLGWGHWIVGGAFGDFLCRLVNFAEELSFGVSIESMVLIAVERFWSVLFPMKPPLISSRMTPTLIAFSWIFAVLSFSYYFAAYKLVTKNNHLFCQFSLPQIFDSWQDLWRADRIIMFSIFVVVPFVLLVVLYTAIVISLYQKKVDISTNLRKKQQKLRAIKNKRITVMLIIIVALFFLSWTPHYLYIFVHYFSWSREQQWSCTAKKKLYLAAKYMNYLYPALNPFIYYIFNNGYRKGFQAILFCRGQNQSRVSPSKKRNETIPNPNRIVQGSATVMK